MVLANLVISRGYQLGTAHALLIDVTAILAQCNGEEKMTDPRFPEFTMTDREADVYEEMKQAKPTDEQIAAVQKLIFNGGMHYTATLIEAMALAFENELGLDAQVTASILRQTADLIAKHEAVII